MKGRVRYLGLGGAIAGVALLALALQATTGPEARAEAEGEESALIQAMNVLNDGMRQLRREARREAYNEETVEMVGEMLAAAVVSLRETPPIAAEVDEEERPEFLLTYTKMSADVVRELLDLKIAILEERNDDVMDHLRTLIDMEHEGHDKFDPAN